MPISQKVSARDHCTLLAYFDRAVNCQPGYRAGAIIAEARVTRLIFLILFDKIPPTFIENPRTFILKLSPALYLPILYFQKFILSQIEVPYVCQFLRKFQLEIIFLCSHTNQKCQAKIPKKFNRRVNCQPSFPASAIIAEPRVLLLLFIIFFHENSSNFH